MVRTIFVIYTDCPLNNLQDINSHKRYAFLCENDYITIGDMIEDKRYSPKMQVVAMCSHTDPYYDGILLKTIKPIRVNGISIDVFNKYRAKEIKEAKQSNNKQMESRNIKVTIEQAREWYNSNNATLKTLALNAFTEEELMMCLAYVYKNVETDIAAFDVPEEEVKRFKVKADLATIAKYFNGDWSMRPGIKGWFIGNYSDSCGRAVVTYNKVGIYEHHTVQYEGITYFKSLKAAMKAVELLGDKVKLLFC